jgi:protocatechuate 3,4-dioxygenase beta subunit
MVVTNAPQADAESNAEPMKGKMKQTAPPPEEVNVSNLPDVSDVTPENITAQVTAINSSCQNPRQRFLMQRLVSHLHDFVRETNLTSEEWITAIKFLTATGQICSPIRQEFILLSDTLGVSALVDCLNHPPVANSTLNTVLGPFFTDDAADLAHGESIASEGKGDYMYVQGRVLATSPNGETQPIANAVIETWETDENGFYDTQYSDRDHPDCRGRFRTDSEGRYGFRAVVPVPYPIPNDGPVGKMLESLGRHVYRPAHLHFMISAPGYETLTTALYFKGDKFLGTDAVFGVKKALIVECKTVTSDEEARAKGFPKGGAFQLLDHDFFLVANQDAEAAREKLRQQAAQKLGEQGVSL